MLTNDSYCFSALRKLDVDDFFIMVSLYEGLFSTRISEILDTDLSCVRKRIKKIERHMPGTFEKMRVGSSKQILNLKMSRHVLTEKGRKLAAACQPLLAALLATHNL